MTRGRDGPATSVGRILVVEDSPSARRLMQDVLLRLGAELPNIRVVSSIGEALTMFSQWRPSVVFVDVELRSPAPGSLPTEAPPPSDRDPKDGAALASLFLKRNPGVRIILCTAADPSDPRITELVSHHQVEIIVKPLLASRVEQVLARGTAADSRARS
jgi:CheY-like chemotaxis protein